jgi:hypothetical protein
MYRAKKEFQRERLTTSAGQRFHSWQRRGEYTLDMERVINSWKFGLLFWLFFLVSIALSDGRPWLDAAWYGACVVFMLVMSVWMVTRRRPGTSRR